MSLLIGRTYMTNETKPNSNADRLAEYHRRLIQRAKDSYEAAQVPSGYIIAPGKALTTPRGVIGEGKIITPIDFETDDAFQQRLAEGYITKVGET